ncbi:MAG: hypothetical protein R3F14_02765 [Polyangiaceae bacterium]
MVGFVVDDDDFLGARLGVFVLEVVVKALALEPAVEEFEVALAVLADEFLRPDTSLSGCGRRSRRW